MFEFKTLKGTVFAKDYRRLVIGERGAYIEFSSENIVATCRIKTGEEYRGLGKYSFCKYQWLHPVGEPEVKVYLQLRTVDYADYKVGFYYVDPKLLTWPENTILRTELQ